jgi:hypothetical protein
MSELADYSGPFKPDLTLKDLSKDFLIRLIEVHQYAWVTMTESWYRSVEKRYGSEVGLDTELEAWKRLTEKLGPRYQKAANIQLNTVADSVKITQIVLDNSRVDSPFPSKWEAIDDNHITQTIEKCQSLDFFERKAPERIQKVCEVNEKQMIQRYIVNPYVKLRPLKLPPRSSKDEIACKWEYTMSGEKQWLPGEY